ncbi:hypothetical protein Pan216_04960 [Planctomycetes bacterium Pan216]|uniref:Uncharacterized protein n=1 Tax=Kolteria novifilia TaxID=2527975 RepID=A0A518AY60_9BACT|nr:hypothetical protein Pan216_04960 [Planctomycetes bacterium Pan216]
MSELKPSGPTPACKLMLWGGLFITALAILLLFFLPNNQQFAWIIIGVGFIVTGLGKACYRTHSQR